MAIAVIGVVTLMYWPVWHAGFVWDDQLCLHDAGWLRSGDNWKHFLLRDYCEWKNYFRPLAVGLFTIEVRTFDSLAGPMHLVSLATHLVNTLLVGFLALKLTGNKQRSVKSQTLAGLSMLLYGIHPALVEPIVWIGCQAEVMVALFTLLAILCNVTMRQALIRASAVAMCFFLATGFKESAIALPPLLIMIDIARAAASADGLSWGTRIRNLWQRQWTVYSGMLIAGIAYLAIRWWALGQLVQPLSVEPFFSVAHFQEICSLYITYLRILVWPMIRLGPVHLSTADFSLVTAQSLSIDFLALGILLAGLYGLWRRHPLGGLVSCASVGLLPVLHIVPVAFDPSLYHERYVMMSLAATCILMPSMFDKNLVVTGLRSLKAVLPLVLVMWIGLALANVRATLPLWSDDITLWQWVLLVNPDSIVAKDHLLTAYMARNDLPHARALAASIVAEDLQCPSCMLNAAYLALAERDIPRASAVLDKLKTDDTLAHDASLFRHYISAVGELLELQGDTAGAEGAYREAIRMDPLNPVSQMTLALLLAQKGDLPEARKIMDQALALSAPDEREERRRTFDAKLAREPATNLKH